MPHDDHPSLLPHVVVPEPTFVSTTICVKKKRARDILDTAHRRAAPIGELQARLRGGKPMRQTTPGLASQVPDDLSPVDEELDDSDEEEGGGQDLVQMRGESRLSPVATCREYSTSAWLHFPHIELVVLFFAFEGAVASFASAMRHSECPEVFYTALAALVSAKKQT